MNPTIEHNRVRSYQNAAMQADTLNTQLKPFVQQQYARQERENARCRCERSRKRWRIAAIFFFCLFVLESCLPQPTAQTQSQHMDNTQ